MHLVVSSRTSSDLRIRLFCILHLRIFGFGYSTTSTSSDQTVCNFYIFGSLDSTSILLLRISDPTILHLHLRIFGLCYFHPLLHWVFGSELHPSTLSPDLRIILRILIGPSSIFEAEDSSDSLELSDTFIRLRPIFVVEELLFIRIHPTIFIRIYSEYYSTP